MGKINIYIDGNNLYRGAEELGFQIDYKKFFRWLCQKYHPSNIYLFIGYISTRIGFYRYLQGCGFILVFKQTIRVNGTVKGNCDAELVLKTTSDFYLGHFEKCILITGDGDFGCLVNFLREHEALEKVLSPDKNKCSLLLKNKNIEITFLNEIYPKFSNRVQK